MFIACKSLHELSFLTSPTSAPTTLPFLTKCDPSSGLLIFCASDLDDCTSPDSLLRSQVSVQIPPPQIQRALAPLPFKFSSFLSLLLALHCFLIPFYFFIELVSKITIHIFLVNSCTFILIEFLPKQLGRNNTALLSILPGTSCIF